MRSQSDHAAESQSKATSEPVPSLEPVPNTNKDALVLRTWTDSTGRYKTRARFGGMVLGKAMLIKEDGATIQVSLEKLCAEDREWIEKRGK